MGFNPLNIVKGVLGRLASEIPVIGDDLAALLTKSDDAMKNLSPAQRVVVEQAMMSDMTENFRLALADSSDLRKLAMAELEHPGIKWVRPGILAGLFLLVVFWIAVVPIIGAFGVTVPAPDISAIPSELWWLFGSAYLGYGTMREVGKANKLQSVKNR